MVHRCVGGKHNPSIQHLAPQETHQEMRCPNLTFFIYDMYYIIQKEKKNKQLSIG